MIVEISAGGDCARGRKWHYQIYQKSRRLLADQALIPIQILGVGKSDASICPKQTGVRSVPAIAR